MAVDTPFLTVLKTWTSPLEHSVIIHVCVRLEFPEFSARAPCLRTSKLDRFVSGFAPNTCVFPWRGRECLVRHPHTPPAVARGHRLVGVATDTILCRSALFCAGRHYFWQNDHFALPTTLQLFLEIFSDSFLVFVSPPYTCMEG